MSGAKKAAFPYQIGQEYTVHVGASLSDQVSQSPHYHIFRFESKPTSCRQLKTATAVVKNDQIELEYGKSSDGPTFHFTGSSSVSQKVPRARLTANLPACGRCSRALSSLVLVALACWRAAVLGFTGCWSSP
eukprot:m.303257 g.303257  ORF g.303257 m.303257 type:complete len:132 (+) comp55245_c0_seq1:62-457(+)